MNRILTGDRPTGRLHLGHYVGSLSNRVKLQSEMDTYIMLADVQALTDNYDNPKKIQDNIYQVLIDYLSVGIDPKYSNIFIQSQIPEIAELTVFFMNLVSHSEVLRNPTVKTEIKEKRFSTGVPFGFVAYPISQAADILILRANNVPVGNDQAPMVELADYIAQRFNKVYKTDIFPKVKGIYSDIPRLVGIDGGAKMSKSLNNFISLSEDRETLHRKIMSMYTDPNRVKATDPGKVEGNPVFIYHDAFNTNLEEVKDLKERYIKGMVGDVEVKEKLEIALNIFLDPIREKRKYFESHMDEVMDIIKSGTAKARAEAKITMDLVREAIGINYY